MDIKNPGAGGAERYCHEVAKRLARNNVEVIWISSRYKGSSKEEDVDGYRVVRVGNVYSVHLLALFEFVKVKKKSIIFESINGVPFLFTLLSRTKKVRMIHHIVPYSVISKKLGLAAPVIFFLQNLLTPIIYGNSTILADSQSVANDLRSLGFRNVKQVKTGGAEPRNKVLEKQDHLVVSGGPIRPWKRIDHVIEAFASMGREWKLVIFGNFESRGYEKFLRKLTAELKVSDRVAFLGYVDEETKWRIYAKAKLMIVASQKEGWGLVAMEAQSSGTPVIGYDVPGIRDSVEDGNTGILVKDGDLDQLRGALKLISNNEELLTTYSMNAIRRSREYSWENSYSDFEDVLRSLL